MEILKDQSLANKQEKLFEFLDDDDMEKERSFKLTNQSDADEEKDSESMCSEEDFKGERNDECITVSELE